jgi:hypothetical protein
MLRRTSIFASDSIYGSRSAFRCVRGVKHRHTIFHAPVGPVRIQKMYVETRYAEVAFLHPVRPVAQVLCSSASGAWNIDALFFMFWWAQCRSQKKRASTRYAKHVFLHSVQSAGHLVHLVASGECWHFLCSSACARNCQCSTSLGAFYGYHIYIFPREEGSLLCLRLTQRATPTSTTRLYRSYVNEHTH